MYFCDANPKIQWTRRGASSERKQQSTTITNMAPRKKPQQEGRREVEEDRPTVADLDGESAFAQLAQKHWLKPSKKSAKVKVKHDVLKDEIWDVLEKEDFAFKSLLALENLQILEKYKKDLHIFS